MSVDMEHFFFQNLRCASGHITGIIGSNPQLYLHIILHLHRIEDFVLVEATRSLVRLGESGHIISDHKGHKSILLRTNIGYKVHRRSPSTDCIVNSR